MQNPSGMYVTLVICLFLKLIILVFTLFPFFQHPWQGHPPLEMILMQLVPHLSMHAIVQWFPCHCFQVWPLALDQLF
jgi:hypothetical protein